MKLINTRVGLALGFLQLTVDLRILSMQMTRYYSNQVIATSLPAHPPGSFAEERNVPEPGKLLAINSDLPIHPIDFPSHPCQCDFCPAKPNPSERSPDRTYATRRLSGVSSCITLPPQPMPRSAVGQAAHAAKCLHDFFENPAISIPRKLLVHSQIVLTILRFGSSHTSPIGSTSYTMKFFDKSSISKSFFHHRALTGCSNEYLSRSLMNPHPSYFHRPNIFLLHKKATKEVVAEDTRLHWLGRRFFKSHGRRYRDVVSGTVCQPS